MSDIHPKLNIGGSDWLETKEEFRLGMNLLNKNVNVKALKSKTNYDVTEDFKRIVVQYCSESVVFEVDGMKFKATCERIE